MIKFKSTKGGGLEAYGKMLDKLTKGNARQAVIQTINKSGMKFRTAARRRVAKEMGLPQKEIKDGVKLYKASSKGSGSEFVAKLVVTGGRIRLIKFKANQKYKKSKGLFRGAGVTAKPWGDKTTYSAAFIAPVRYGKGDKAGSTMGVFVRKSSQPFPIKQLYGGGPAREAERHEAPLWVLYSNELDVISVREVQRRLDMSMSK